MQQFDCPKFVFFLPKIFLYHVILVEIFRNADISKNVEKICS